MSQRQCWSCDNFKWLIRLTTGNRDVLTAHTHTHTLTYISAAAVSPVPDAPAPSSPSPAPGAPGGRRSHPGSPPGYRKRRAAGRSSAGWQQLGRESPSPWGTDTRAQWGETKFNNYNRADYTFLPLCVRNTHFHFHGFIKTKQKCKRYTVDVVVMWCLRWSLSGGWRRLLLLL